MQSTPTDASAAIAKEQRTHPVHIWFQKGYLYIALFFVLCVIVQVFFAGAGILVSGLWLLWHQAFGSYIILIPILLLIFGLLGHLPGSVNWFTVLLVVLALLQPILIWPMRHLGLAMAAAFHPVNALILFALPLYLSYRVWRLLRSERR
jgi:hypothetical protein